RGHAQRRVVGHGPHRVVGEQRDVLVEVAAVGELGDARQEAADLRVGLGAHETITLPPSTTRTWPLTMSASLDAKNTAGPTMCSASVLRRIADMVANIGWKSVGTCFSVAAVLVSPGAMQFTVTLNCPSCPAMCR